MTEQAKSTIGYFNNSWTSCFEERLLSSQQE